MNSSAASARQLKATRAALPVEGVLEDSPEVDAGEAPMSGEDAVQAVSRLRRAFRNAPPELPDSVWPLIRAGN